MLQGPEPPITGRKIRQLGSRIYRIARFDRETFRELKEDKNATGQAVAVLLLVGLSYGLGFSIFNGVQYATSALNLGCRPAHPRLHPDDNLDARHLRYSPFRSVLTSYQP